MSRLTTITLNSITEITVGFIVLLGIDCVCNLRN